MHILFNPELDAYQYLLNELQIIAIMHPRLAKRARVLEKRVTAEFFTCGACVSFTKLRNEYLKAKLSPNSKSNAVKNLSIFEECFLQLNTYQ